jgi:2-keto-4-pentenoate hydratase/2-oxohepta-3-ene-1,7-dioic acid hydratase in catechol pathway
LSTINRRSWIQQTAGGVLAISTGTFAKDGQAREPSENYSPAAAAQDAASIKYGRFQFDNTVAYGVVEGDRVRQLRGELFGVHEPTENNFPIDDVKWLVPVRPTQVVALAGNYKSHLPGETLDPMYQIPQPFYKSPSCLLPNAEAIVLPHDAEDVHYEAEMVLVMGRLARHVLKEQALDYVFGVTCGNDVSARQWQKNDRQWWRAKSCETFGPIGPWIATGVDYDNLLLTLRLNGEVKQQQRTSDLIHDVATIVSFISRHHTLYPGDLIFTGTPGKTSAIEPGDQVDVELEGVGILSNTVTAQRA